MLPLFLALLSMQPSVLAHNGSKAPSIIYGEDDRREIYEIGPEQRALADSTVMLFSFGSASLSADAAVLNLWSRPYVATNKGAPLCQDTRFYGQPTVFGCSGGLIRPNVVLTAAHCLSSINCDKNEFQQSLGSWIGFGFTITEKGNENGLTAMPAAQAYRCARKIGGNALMDASQDWGLIVLDRPVEGHTPLEISDKPLTTGATIFAFGHPSGLPTKFIGGANIKGVEENGVHYANLDAEGGISGGMVFDADRKVAGIISGGDMRFYAKADDKICWSNNRVPDDLGLPEGAGEGPYSYAYEHIIPVSRVLPALLKLDEELANGLPYGPRPPLDLSSTDKGPAFRQLRDAASR
jgi:hypothetical protein